MSSRGPPKQRSRRIVTETQPLQSSRQAGGADGGTTTPSSRRQSFAKPDASKSEDATTETVFGRRRSIQDDATPSQPEPGSRKQMTPREPRERRPTNEVGGNDRASVKVVTRIRPRVQRENQDKEGVQTSLDNKSLTLTDGKTAKQFTFDEIFDSRNEHGSQERVFELFGKDLVNQSLKGYNVCVFAYGHTGSGKTYTMMGDGSEYTPNVRGEGAGILPRFLHDVFSSHQDVCQDDLQYSCEYFEVYNEQIRDLLTPAKSGADRTRKVHVHPKHGVFVQGLTVSMVNGAEEALGLLAFGNQMRTVASTTMNARSSRSHAIFTFRFEHKSDVAGGGDPINRLSRVLFVDLAGREDQTATKNKAAQFREMCHINTSLFHLAHLITKLSECQIEQGLADFRNSKLNLVLSQALVGNSRTALVATLSPSVCLFEDSILTLNFASSVKKIQTRPMINNKSSNGVAAELEAEVRRLQDELVTKDSKTADLENHLVDVQAMLAHYKRSYEEMRSHSDQAAVAREEMAQKIGLHGGFIAGQQAPRTPTGELQPFFTKLCDDPCLQGCCNYFLAAGPSNSASCVFGSDDRCDIVLHGVGVGPQMCKVQYSVRSGVSVEVLGLDEDGKRVLLNGRRLRRQDGTQQMEHNDCLIIGYAQGFRLVCPTREMMLGTGEPEARSLARGSVPKLDMESALLEIADEEGGQFKQAFSYINQLSARAPEHVVQAFLKALHCICPLIDEANLITTAIFGEACYEFSLRALSDVFDFEHDAPTLVVCMSQKSKTPTKTVPEAQQVLQSGRRSFVDVPREQGNSIEVESNELASMSRHPLCSAMGLDSHMQIGSECDPMLYVWSLEKFLFRMHEFRELYQEGHETGDDFATVRRRLSANTLTNPWKETTLAATKLLHEGMKQASTSPAMAYHFLNHAAGSVWGTLGPGAGVSSTPGSAVHTPRGKSGNATPKTGTPSATAALVGAAQQAVAIAAGGYAGNLLDPGVPNGSNRASEEPHVSPPMPPGSWLEPVGNGCGGSIPSVGCVVPRLQLGATAPPATTSGASIGSARAATAADIASAGQLRSAIRELGGTRMEEEEETDAFEETSDRGIGQLPPPGWRATDRSSCNTLPSAEGGDSMMSARGSARGASSTIAAAPGSPTAQHRAAVNEAVAAAAAAVSALRQRDTGQLGLPDDFAGVLGNEADRLRNELQTRNIEVGHLLEERDRLAGLLQGLLERVAPANPGCNAIVGSPSSSSRRLVVGSAFAHQSNTEIGAVATGARSCSPPPVVPIAPDQAPVAYPKAVQPIYMWSAPACNSPPVPAPVVVNGGHGGKHQVWPVLQPSVRIQALSPSPPSSPRASSPRLGMQTQQTYTPRERAAFRWPVPQPAVQAGPPSLVMTVTSPPIPSPPHRSSSPLSGRAPRVASSVFFPVQTVVAKPPPGAAPDTLEPLSTDVPSGQRSRLSARSTPNSIPRRALLSTDGGSLKTPRASDTPRKFAQLHQPARGPVSRQDEDPLLSRSTFQRQPKVDSRSNIAMQVSE